MKVSTYIRVILAAAGLYVPLAAAEGVFDTVVDPQDGHLDASEWLLDKKGFLPVPIIITEPAVGYGAGLALLFFRESIREKAAEGAKTVREAPPDIFGVFFAETENDTKFVGGGGMFTFLNDQWRYRGGVGRSEIHLDFFGAGGDLGTGDRKIGYTLEGWVSSHQVMRRIGDTDHLMALRWVWFDLESRFESDKTRPMLSSRETARTGSGVGPSWERDTRDNIMTPSRGWFAAIDTLFFSPSFGSDNTYQTYRTRALGYIPFGASFVLGARLDGSTARGDVPFYQLPYIDLRGIPAMRFQDESVGMAELELRWNFTPRWALVGFTGVGYAWGRQAGFSDALSESTEGIGMRYQIARRLGLYAGIDVAWGPEDTALYIQVGSAWR